LSPVATFLDDGCPSGCVSKTCGGSTYRCWKTPPACFAGLCY
jgi:hypothetical protein